MWGALAAIAGSIISVAYFFAVGVVIHGARDDSSRLAKIAMSLAIGLYLVAVLALLALV